MTLLAGVVLAGYASGAAELVRVLPWSAPMRLPTAAGFFFAGLSVLFLVVGWRRATAAFAALSGLVGAELLREFVSATPATPLERSMFPGGLSGSSASLTGACLIVGALALIFMSGVIRPRRRLMVVGVLGSIVGSIGAVAFLSYCAGMSAAFTAGHLTTMSIHTAFCFALLGSVVVRFAWADSTTGETGAPSWVAGLVVIGVVTVTVCLWEASLAANWAELRRTVGFDLKYLHDDTEAQIENRIQALIRLARRRAVKDMPKTDWEADVQNILNGGGYQGIEWVDSSLRALWITPPGAGDALPDGNAGFEGRRRKAFDAARSTRELAIAGPLDLVSGGKGMLVCVPVYIEDSLQGYVAGVFRYDQLFKTVLNPGIASRYSVTVLEGEQELFTHGATSADNKWTQAIPLNMHGARWTLRASPGEGLIAQANSPEQGALLVAGCILALLAGLHVHLMLGRHESPAAFLAPGQPNVDAAVLGAAGAPVVSYARDGSLQAWNQAACDLFGGSLPAIRAAAEGFRVVTVTVLRASSSGDSTRRLRQLLDSCSMPVIAFDAEGAFSTANEAAACMLDWTDEVWSGRRAGHTIYSGDSIGIVYAVLIQGQTAINGTTAPPPPQEVAAAMKTLGI